MTLRPETLRLGTLRPSTLRRGTLRLGTRGSALALAQSEQVAKALTEHTGVDVELVEVTTFGDVSRAAIDRLGGTGVFVTALRDRLLADEVDFAVHSLKDLPTAPAPGLVVAAVPAREDPRDALVARDGLGLHTLPPGSRVGTGAPRRVAQLRALGLGLDVVPLRGNVDTRLRTVADRSLDAVVLARAGLARLGRLDEVTETLDPETVLPAPGQGALAVECRADAADIVALLRALDDPTARATVLAERALLAALEAGCTAPVGALATVGANNEISVRAVVAALDGARTLRRSATGNLDEAEAIGRRLADDLLAAGAADLMGTQQ